MRRVICGLVLMAPLVAMADNGPGCGWGSQLWKGDTGLFAHTSAGTTNSSSSNPLLGLLSGTSGCENPGVVKNDFQQKMFVAQNLDDLAKDVAQGSGDHLNSMANLMGIEEGDKGQFYKLAQANYGSIFKSSDSDYNDVLAALNGVMASDKHLLRYVR